MKALVYEKYAEENDFASILKLKDIPEPNVKSNEVLFRVKAAALNYDDIWGMRGTVSYTHLTLPTIYSV